MSLSYKNLHTHFFELFPRETNKFIALSGYLGIEPVFNLKKLPFDSEVIYGMFNEMPRPQLHQKMLELNDSKTKIYYPSFLCHSKCYIWLQDNKPLKALIGSANFSSNGLYNDYRETLFEVEPRELYSIKAYIELILDTSIICTEHGIPIKVTPPINQEVCDMPLYNVQTGQTQNAAGINWGMNSGKNHTKENDAYIAILKDHIKKYPNLFPPKLPKIQNKKRQNEVIEIIWDDGTDMEGLFEGSQEYNGITYPKQISSAPSKEILGKYLRKRIGVREGEKVLREDLLKYGRDFVSISLLSEGVYFFDFKSSNRMIIK